MFPLSAIERRIVAIGSVILTLVSGCLIVGLMALTG